MLICYAQWFNAYVNNDDKAPRSDQVRPGDFLVHFAGVANREYYLNIWSNISESRDSKWDKEFSETNYPDEVSSFWEDVKERKLSVVRRWEGTRRKLQVAIEGEATAENMEPLATTGRLENVATVLQSGREALAWSATLDERSATDDDIHSLETVIERIEQAASTLAATIRI